MSHWEIIYGKKRMSHMMLIRKLGWYKNKSKRGGEVNRLRKLFQQLEVDSLVVTEVKVNGFIICV